MGYPWRFLSYWLPIGEGGVGTNEDKIGMNEYGMG